MRNLRGQWYAPQLHMRPAYARHVRAATVPPTVPADRLNRWSAHDMWARDRHVAAAATHDRLNVRAVAVLCSLCAVCVLQPSAMANAALSWAVLAYVVGDLLYHAAVPHCQPSYQRLATIVLHHLATLWLVLHPIAHPEHAHMTLHGTLVEINTLLHNANKVYKKPALKAAFYATWFGLRLGYCPYLLLVFDRLMRASGAAPWDYTYSQVVGSHALLCALNVYWTCEVAMGMRRKGSRKSA